VISAFRATSPEVRQHLASAATSLVSAAAGVLATQVPEPEAERGRRSSETIDDDGAHPDEQEEDR
jgi:hypothetical protein